MEEPNQIIKDLVGIRTTGDPDRWNTINRAIAEIERLRAGQFRWIAVSERLPNRNDSYAVVVHWPSGSYGAFLWDEVGAVGEAARITHWASIPPLPEPTQEEKDEKMFYQWYNNAVGNGAIQAFHAGLKAARGEK